MHTCLALCGRSHWRFERCHSSAKTSEHTFLINVTNYSVLRLVLRENGYFDLCWLLDIRCYYPIGLPRPHGISHTSFIVYLPNLRIKVTVAFGNFTAFGQLVRLIRLGIRFLFVRPRFRYCFFSPKGHPLKLASRYGVRWQLRPVWTFTTDVWHARHTDEVSTPRGCLLRGEKLHDFYLPAKLQRPCN